jgi:predicted transcriptional regulator
MASQTAPSDFRGISSVADGINHAVPTHKELQSSILWLIQKGFVEKINSKYRLTEKGRNEYEEASKGLTTVFKIWKALEVRVGF